jgi:UDPglucose 6-dehydrogenase
LEVAVVGVGHVGLVSAVSLASVGHRVRAQDVDHHRIEQLVSGQVPFLEPWVSDLMARASAEGRITFHAAPDEALPGADLIFLCVDTPSRPDGHVDLSALARAAEAAIDHAGENTVIVNRSTAPVGTAAYIRSLVEEHGAKRPLVAVNPEFLAEGSAVRDFLSPDRVVVGAWEDSAHARILEAFEPIVSRQLPDDLPPEISVPRERRTGPVPVVRTNPETAELIKYAANAFLAMKISFINEMASIAEQLGGDGEEMARAVGLDHRIGPHFLRAGIGWGGSCFPKDIAALQGMAETRGVSARMLRAANEVNLEQHRWVIRKLQTHLRTLVGRRIGLLGLTFKPNTDDLRNAPALEIACDLARSNARVRAFDPAVKSLPAEFEGVVELVGDPESLAEGSEALVVVTDWPEFEDLDLPRLRSLMKSGLLLDGRNLFDPERARRAGFTYVGVGRHS